MNYNSPQNNSVDGKKRLKEILEILMNNDATKALTPEKLSSILQELGPFFIKLGNIMSTRQDILPREYREVLSKLDDNAAPMDYNALQAIIESEYGTSIDAIFSEFDETPIDFSSINQSHKAVLKDGAHVIIKVQRPDVHSVVSTDITLLKKALSVLRLESSSKSSIDLSSILDELWTICQQELNYLIEFKNNKKFIELNESNELLLIPKINEKYSTANILVVEYIDSVRIDNTEELTSRGYDLNEIAAALAANYVKQFLQDGFFHASPNANNISIKNGRIVWSNFSLMGSLSQKELTELNNGIEAAKASDVVALKNSILEITTTNKEVNNSKLYFSLEEMLNKYREMDIREITIVSVVKDLVILLNENGLALPEQFSLLCIGLITLDTLLNTIAPKFNMISLFCESYPSDATDDPQENVETEDKDNVDSNAEAAENLEESTPNTETNESNNPSTAKQDINQVSPVGGNIPQVQPPISVLHSSENSNEKTVDMVAQISDILKMAVDGKTKFNMNLTVSDESLSSIEKIINKLILCLVSVSFLIGSCSIITTNIEPKIFGVSALGLVLFIISFILLLWLLIRIIRKK